MLALGGVLAWAMPASEPLLRGVPDVNSELAMGAVAALVVAVFGVGATWGWSAMRRLNVARTWPRLGLLVVGWILIPGACALIPVVLTTVICLLIGEIEFFQDETYRAMLKMSLLALPGIVVETLAWRKERQSKAA
ncbi:MAG: hypothetical protein M5U26_11075 [Planctomycetota bacterium]|nr:hypothetical protein [Planctomycetota bacterium]